MNIFKREGEIEANFEGFVCPYQKLFVLNVLKLFVLLFELLVIIVAFMPSPIITRFYLLTSKFSM